MTASKVFEPNRTEPNRTESIERTTVMDRRGRHLHRSLVLGTAVAVASGLLLTACGSSDSESGADGKQAITFWDNNGGPDRTPLWKGLIADFQTANPDITVKYVGIPAASVQQKYDTAVAAGGTPDVGGVTTSYLGGLIAQKALEPLDSRVSQAGLDSKLVPSFTDTIRKVATDGKLYEVPTSANLDVLWYRKDLFSQAGLQPPTTWDNFFADVPKLTDAQKNQYGFTIRGGAGAIFQLLTEMYSYSGITSFFDANGKSTINDPANVELIEKIAALYKKNTPSADVNNDFTKMVAQFGGGSVAVMHHNLGSTSNNVKALGAEKVAAVPLPVAKNGVRTIVPNPVDGLVVFTKSKQKDAAWKFIQFITQKSSNSTWNETVGQIPANKEVSGESWLQAQQPVRDALKAIDDPATVTVQAPYYLPEFSAITKTEMGPLFQKVLLGTMPAKEFADTFANKMTEAQAKYSKRVGG
jgi:multiple sugar transport system substrate-binding protein